MRRLIALGLVVLGLVGCDDTLFASSAPSYPPNWTGVQQLLEDHCEQCHPAIEPAVDLPEDIEQDILDETGIWVVPGDADASMLWRLIADERLDGDPQAMPPGTLLPLESVSFVKDWINEGAPL